MNKKLTDKEISRYLFNIVKDVKWYLLSITTISVITSILHALSPVVYQQMIDKVIPQRDYKMLILYVFVIISIPIINALFAMLQNKVSYNCTQKTTEKLQRKYFGRILRMPYSEFEKRKPADLLNNMVFDVSHITERYVNQYYLYAVKNIIQIVVIFIVVARYNIWAAVISVTVIPVLLLAISFTKSKMKEVFSNSAAVIKKRDAFFLQVFEGMKIIRMFNGENKEENNLSNIQKEVRETQWKSVNKDRTIHFFIPTMVAQIILGVIIIVSVSQIMKDHMSLGALVAMVAYVPTLIDCIGSVLKLKSGKNIIAFAIENLEGIEETPETETDIGLNTDLQKIVEINDVNFSYDREGFNLYINNLEVNKGDFVTILGPTGSGKSSVFDIINNFYPVKSGNIKIYETDIENINLYQLRDIIANVSQNGFLFNTTIRENISYPDAPDDEKIDEVIKKAELEEFISSLPDGLDTVVANNGENFSGGERQRINLARALYRNCKIILLDEPTSALDAETSKEIFEMLKTENRENSVTIILITHDPGKAMYGNKTIVIDDGRITERGTPDELLKKEGLFAKLYSAQQNN